MRVAPIGLYLHERFSADEIDMIGAKAAALTHGHELGYIPAAMLVHIINLISHDETIGLLPAIIDSLAAVKRLFPHAQHIDELSRLVDKAIDFAHKDTNDVDAIHQLGGGWVAEETLAIAIYCSLKYQHDFDQAIIACHDDPRGEAHGVDEQKDADDDLGNAQEDTGYSLLWFTHNEYSLQTEWIYFLTNSTPSVLGPQWQETVQPAWDSHTSSKSPYRIPASLAAATASSVAAGCVMKTVSRRMSSRPSSLSFT